MESWFQNLRDYFPAREMKSKEHMRRLLEEKAEYKLEEGPEYTLVYFEKPDYLFIDYVLVSGTSRGSGHGSKLMERLKKKEKLMILEVDPITADDPASAKRVRFYKKLGFKEASSIHYVRQHPITGEQNEMNIFYWCPEGRSEEWVLRKMQEVYEEVHAYEGETLYGSPPQTAEEVLLQREQHDIKTK